MANLTTAISVQIDSKDKEQVTEILQRLGVTMSGLINMTIKQVIMRRGIPFEVALPKNEDNLLQYFTKEQLEETAKELKYMETHLNEYKSYNNVNELFEDLENEN